MLLPACPLQGGAASLADDGGEWQADGMAPAGWMPAEGDTVRVLKMGGAAGKVVSAASKSGGKVGVRVGSMTVELRLSDLAPAGGASPGMAASAAARRARSSSEGGGGTSLRSAAQQLRARGSLSTSSDGREDGSGVGAAPAIQTSRNTVDVRGRTADDAAAEVQAAVLSAQSGCLFVVHGVGTGRVRAEVLKMLRRMPRVVRLEEAEASNGGCTVAHLT